MKPTSILFAFAAAVLVILTGCVSTFKEVKPLSGGPPPKEKPTLLALGDIKITDVHCPELERQLLLNAFQVGVEKWCAEHKALEIRKDVPATNMPPGAIQLTGTITEVNKGSAAARFWVGMGAGQERARGEFAIHAADGTKLTEFAARKSYLGGSGIGGVDMMQVDGLVDQLGQLVAETIDKWLRGQKIE